MHTAAPRRPPIVRLSLVVLLPLLGACSGTDGPAATATAAAAPSTDIFTMSIDWRDGRPALGEPTNRTDRPGYDNQPRFTDDGTTILYTRIDDGQADVWALPADPADGTPPARRTTTPESEYSPTPRPDGSFTVVRVEPDGRQRLWRFPGTPGSTEPELLAPDLEPVGYHAWADGGRYLVAFVLDEPPRLVVAEPESPRPPLTVATDVGRALVPLDRFRVAYVQKGEQETRWRIDVLDTRSGTTQTFVDRARPGREDFAVDPRGGLWMGDGSTLFYRPATADADAPWQEVANFAAAGLDDITRLAISPAGDRVVLVAVPR